MSSTWFDFAPLSQLPPGTREIKIIEGEEIAVFNIENNFFAIQNECPHAYLPLAEDGLIEDTSITCPHHGAKFCLKTGAVEAPPAFDDLTCYETRICEDFLQIKITTL